MFEHRSRVYYEDTDASGVMYHARYLAFFERARTEFLRSLGYGQHTLMQQEGIAFTLSDLQIRYRAPARLDDELLISVIVEKAGAASIQFSQSMWHHDPSHADTPALLSQLSVRAGCVSYPAFQVTRIPAGVRAALREQ